MISYSTNFMGPISMDWYRKRGLTHMATKTCESEIVRNALRTSQVFNYPNIEIGDNYDVEEITTHYAGGRIDIYGLDPEDYYDGTDEYALRVMHGEDWNALSDWLDEFVSEEQVPYDELIRLFEENYGKKIRWADEIWQMR